VNSLGYPAAFVRDVIEILRAATRIDVRDAISLFDRDSIPQQTPQRT
jgi:hypothetical protein